MWTEPGLLEPITAVDVNVAHPGGAVPLDVNVARRVDGGPIEYFAVADPFNNQSDRYRASANLLAERYDVKVRAVLVEGIAPDIIEDIDGNGRLNAKDLELMGFTLLSNQASKKLTLVQKDKFGEFFENGICPSSSAIFQTELDGFGPPSECFFSNGTSRSIRRPPL